MYRHKHTSHTRRRIGVGRYSYGDNPIPTILISNIHYITKTIYIFIIFHDTPLVFLSEMQ